MIRNWLRSWLGIVDPVACNCSARITELENTIVANETAHAQEIAELRGRLEMPVKRKPSGRPFAVLAKIAEMGAQRNAG